MPLRAHHQIVSIDDLCDRASAGLTARYPTRFRDGAPRIAEVTDVIRGSSSATSSRRSGSTQWRASRARNGAAIRSATGCWTSRVE